jgi:hypothetical protein
MMLSLASSTIHHRITIRPRKYSARPSFNSGEASSIGRYLSVIGVVTLVFKYWPTSFKARSMSATACLIHVSQTWLSDTIFGWGHIVKTEVGPKVQGRMSHTDFFLCIMAAKFIHNGHRVMRYDEYK